MLRVKGFGFRVFTSRRVGTIFSLLLCLVAALGLGSGCTSDSEESQEEELIGTAALEWGRHGNGRHGRGHRDHHDAQHCSLELGEESITRRFSARGRDGLRVDVSVVQQLPAGEVVEDIRFRRHGRDLIHFVVEARIPTSGFRITADFDSPIRGVRHMVIDSSDGETGIAVVDGRTSNPFLLADDPTFPDGRRPPAVRIDRHLRRMVDELFADAKSDAIACWKRKEERGALEPPEEPLAAGTPGHQSNTFARAGCLLALSACVSSWYGCMGFFGSACGLTGPGAVYTCPLVVGGCGAEILLCYDIALNSSACCPKDCGSGFLQVQCCNASESCLSELTGLCCDSNTEPCLGQECCSQGQECCVDPDTRTAGCCSAGDNCLASGCCTAEKTCGSVCCETDSQCLNSTTGTCCAVEDTCGTVGQIPAAVCCPNEHSYCADAANSICCGKVSLFCGGRCCGPGQVCENDTCAAPPPGVCQFPCPGGSSTECDQFPEFDDWVAVCSVDNCCFAEPR